MGMARRRKEKDFYKGGRMEQGNQPINHKSLFQFLQLSSSFPCYIDPFGGEAETSVEKEHFPLSGWEAGLQNCDLPMKRQCWVKIQRCNML